MRGLVIGTRRCGVEGEQVWPFLAFRGGLRRSSGIDFRVVHAEGLAETARALDAHACDVAFVMTSFREDVRETAAFFERVAARDDRPAIVYLDSFDSSATPLLGILAHVDLYVKKQVLRDRSGYLRAPAGGWVYTDYLARERGWDLGGWSFGSRACAGLEDRIVCGWNIGVAGRMRRELRRGALRMRARKTIDVHCRVGYGAPGNRDWYWRQRSACVEILRSMSRRVVASGDHRGGAGLVSERRYMRELSRSRVVVSPFGWGELCWRDFEAMSRGCLLVKPDVSHLETWPDVFVAEETYAPVRWDWSDLREVVARYLDDEGERRRIAGNARRAYAACLREGPIVARIGAIARRAMDARHTRRAA